MVKIAIFLFFDSKVTRYICLFPFSRLHSLYQSINQVPYMCKTITTSTTEVVKSIIHRRTLEFSGIVGL